MTNNFLEIREEFVNLEDNLDIESDIVLSLSNQVMDYLQIDVLTKKDIIEFYNNILSKLPWKTKRDKVRSFAISILTISRQNNETDPILVQEIADAYNFKEYNNISARSIIRQIQKIKPIVGDLLSINIQKSEDYIDRIISEILDSKKIVKRIKKKIDLDQYKLYLLKYSTKILNQIPLSERGGSNPYGFAVASIYVADKLLAKSEKRGSILTHDLLGNVCACSEYTIRVHSYFIRQKISPTF